MKKWIDDLIGYKWDSEGRKGRCYVARRKRMRDEMDKLDAVRNVSKDTGNANNSKAFKIS